MVNNPITTIIGILVALCPVIGALFPEAKDVCDKITAELIGLGFIASADGVKKPAVSTSQLSSFFLVMLLTISLTACAQLKSLQEKVQPILDQVNELVNEIQDTATDMVKPDCKLGESPEKNGCELRNQ